MHSDWHQVLISINGAPEFVAFEGPKANCEAYIAKQQPIPGQKRTHRVQAL